MRDLAPDFRAMSTVLYGIIVLFALERLISEGELLLTLLDNCATTMQVKNAATQKGPFGMVKHFVFCTLGALKCNKAFEKRTQPSEDGKYIGRRCSS